MEKIKDLKFFQFKKGERLGQIVYLKDIILEDAIEYLIFNDGSRLNKSLMDEFLDPLIIKNNDIYFYENEIPNNIVAMANDGNEYVVANPNKLIKKQINMNIFEFFKKFNFKELSSNDKNDIRPVQKIDEPSEHLDIVKNESIVKQDLDKNQTNDEYKIVLSLIDKANKKSTTLNIKLDLDLIKKDLFNLIFESYSLSDDEIVDLIVQNLDINLVKESVKSALIDYYKKNKNLKRDYKKILNDETRD